MSAQPNPNEKSPDPKLSQIAIRNSELPPRGRPPTHGLRSRKLFIAPEDAERFTAMRYAMIEEIAPQDHTEMFIAEQIVTHRWMILHADEAEAAAMRKAFEDTIRYDQKIAQMAKTISPKTEEQYYDAALAATASGKTVHLILRYRTTHERALFKLESILQTRRKCRNAELLRPPVQNFHNSANPGAPSRTEGRNGGLTINEQAHATAKRASQPVQPVSASSQDPSRPIPAVQNFHKSPAAPSHSKIHDPTGPPRKHDAVQNPPNRPARAEDNAQERLEPFNPWLKML